MRFNLAVVTLGYLDVALSMAASVKLPGFTVLRIFRMSKLLRTVKMLRKIPVLLFYVVSFISAMNAMFWGFVILLVMLMVFAIISVDIVHPTSLMVHPEEG